MIFGDPAHERIALNLDTLWSGGPRTSGVENGPARLQEILRLLFEDHDSNAAGVIARDLQGPYTESCQPLGDLLIDYLQGAEHPSSSARYRRELNLRTGIARSEFVVGGASVVQRVVASPDPSIIAIRIERTVKKSLSVRISIRVPHPILRNVAGESTVICAGRVPSHIPHVTRLHPLAADPPVYREDAGMVFAVAVRVIADDRETEADIRPGAGAEVRRASSVTILIAAADSFIDWNTAPHGNTERVIEEAVDTVDRASSFHWDTIAREATRAHAELFDRVRLELDSDPDDDRRPTDERLAATREGAADHGLVELLFDYGRYLLIALSRPGSPANLQGICNDRPQPPWNSNLTTNINLEVNYWAAETTALSECHQPLLDFVCSLEVRGSRTARELYGALVWPAHHETDLWHCSWPVGLGAADLVHAMWPMGAAWLTAHLMEHFEFMLDYLTDDLRDAPPGQRVTAPSTYPEYAFVDTDGRRVSVDVMTTMDQWLIRELFGNFLFAAGHLGIDDEFVASVRSAASALPSIPVSVDGRILEWSTDRAESDPGHRHPSHLYGLYPGSAIDPRDDPSMAAAALASLQRRLSAGGGGAGWSRGSGSSASSHVSARVPLLRTE